jgi:hypothetical protein
MTGYLNSLKADLLDRRLLPLVALVAVALVAAVAYAVLGGGSSAATPAAAVSSAPAAASSGLAVSQTTPEKAVAETTGGGSVQHRGVAHNPFTPLPEAKTATTTTAASAATSTSSSGASATSGSGSSSSSSGGSSSTTPSTTPSTPATPAKPKAVYHVAVLFGVYPAGATPQSVQLTPYENLKLLTPLPSVQQPLIVFRGVTAGGKSATFTLVGEAILHGDAACLPSATQCEAIDLQIGQSEQLEYLPPSGQTVTYELKVVSIVSSKASSAAVKDLLRGESKAGRELLSRTGLDAIPYMRYSAQAGVLVFAGRAASAARAHAAGHRRHGR